MWLGAERHRSQELGSQSHVSKVDLHAVGMWGEGGGPCGGREIRQRWREEGKRLGGEGRGCLSHEDRGSGAFLWTSRLGRGSDSGAISPTRAVVIWVHGQFPAGSSATEMLSSCGRCDCISTWRALGGRCGELGSRAAEPSYSQMHPRAGSRSSWRCKPARWLPVAACPSSVETPVNPC